MPNLLPLSEETPPFDSSEDTISAIFYPSRNTSGVYPRGERSLFIAALDDANRPPRRKRFFFSILGGKALSTPSVLSSELFFCVFSLGVCIWCTNPLESSKSSLQRIPNRRPSEEKFPPIILQKNKRIWNIQILYPCSTNFPGGLFVSHLFSRAWIHFWCTRDVPRMFVFHGIY